MNEVTKTQSNVPVKFSDDDFSTVGSDQDLGSQDILIPKILIMQGQSPKVLEGEASFGELRDTLSWEVLGKAKMGKEDAKTLTIIPFHRELYWIIKIKDGEKFKTETLIKVTPENKKLDPYEQWVGEDGITRKREFLILFFVLIPGKPIPYLLGFKKSSREGGQALGTQMYVMNKRLNVKEAYKRSPMGKVMEIIPRKENKKDTTYIVLEPRVLRESTFEEANEAMYWYKAIVSGKVKTENIDMDDDIELSEEF